MFDVDQRRAPFEPDDFNLEALDTAAATPFLDVRDRLVDISVRPPVWVEGRRLGGYCDIALEFGDDLVLPDLVDKGRNAAAIQFDASVSI